MDGPSLLRLVQEFQREVPSNPNREEEEKQAQKVASIPGPRDHPSLTEKKEKDKEEEESSSFSSDEQPLLMDKEGRKDLAEQ